MLKVKIYTPRDDDRYKPSNELIVIHNGKEILRESDFGEPEDNSFHRDYKWIGPAIEKAYQLGRKDIHDEISS